MWHIAFNPVEYIDFGGVITVAVEVWSWKLFQIKDPLVFGTAIRGYVNQNIVLRRVVWSSRSSARCFDDSTQHDVLFTEPRIAAPNTNRSLIRNNFQDQTSTATVGISPKNMGKMPQNLLKKVFWKINFIKMIKIFVCDRRRGVKNGGKHHMWMAH